MDNAQNLIGWGIIGTPKGRQASGDGLDKQLKLADIMIYHKNFVVTCL